MCIFLGRHARHGSTCQYDCSACLVITGLIFKYRMILLYKTIIKAKRPRPATARVTDRRTDNGRRAPARAEAGSGQCVLVAGRVGILYSSRCAVKALSHRSLHDTARYTVRHGATRRRLSHRILGQHRTAPYGTVLCRAAPDPV